MNSEDFDKEFFQRSWGPNGYYDEFTFGVGFKEVVQKCLVPFFNLQHNALEIGSGGGTFTKKMVGRFAHVTAFDVIKMPEQFEKWGVDKFTYREHFDKAYFVTGTYDFAFAFNVFCHLSNEALTEYIASVNKALNPGGNFIFMIANHHNNPQPECEGYKLGELLPFGHFYQDERTLPLIIGEGWEVVSENMIPEHRDIIVHLKKL